MTFHATGHGRVRAAPWPGFCFRLARQQGPGVAAALESPGVGALAAGV
jgi:hypothetical protein